MKKIIIVMLALVVLISCFVGCKGNNENNEKNIELNVSKESLEDVMTPIISGNKVIGETVMFLEKGEKRDLLFKIDSIESVTSYNGKKTYVEGEDYALTDGKIEILEGSKIPVLTEKRYYAGDGTLLTKNDEGKVKKTFWGEGETMTRWQVRVNYTHSDTWTDFQQPCNASRYAKLFEKLKNKEDVTFFFYGDSITFGANSSYMVGIEPHQHSYTMLFTEAIADLFGYKVNYITSGLSGTSTFPEEPYKADRTPTITYINTAVGGWTSLNGLNEYDKHVKPFIEKYGCDFFSLAFGMNDATFSGDEVYPTQKGIMDKVLEDAPKASLLFVSTMVPNPDATNGWYGKQDTHEPALLKGADEYNSNGTPCSVAQVTSMSQAFLKHKKFRDYTGNNINHPNDFATLMYAQTLLQCVVGYENMK